ncbi:MAG: TIGR01212 family radical SAM protein [Bacteroidales bacterium]|nr:TIGR01212 family radical SAM protein [Bacteroidales bacterium]HOI32066.1 TIGR01212 family radical SAM protein [Bacteroidales bacterium]
MNYPWGDQRRFNSYTAYFKKIFGGRIQKISLDAGFTCPNRDGSKGYGGCTYCVNDAFNPSYCQPSKSITQQLEEGKEFHQKRYRRASKYLAYFQAYSNTYADLDTLRKRYREALSVEGVVGLVIGTRPDVVDDEVLKLLAEIKKEKYVMVEYGVESIYDQTLKRINRGHDFAATKSAIHKTAAFGIPVGAHLIFGLPGESHQMMLDAAEVLSNLPLTTIKFHQLQLFKNTAMAEEYKQNPEEFMLFDLESYIDFIVSFTERLNPAIVIERFAGEVPPRYLISAPFGTLRYDAVLQRIEKELENRDTFQGKKFINPKKSFVIWQTQI